MKFDQLIKILGETHATLTQQAGKSVNCFLTIRNWLIGCHIFEYEQQGEDRAHYGNNVVSNIAASLQQQHVPGCSETALKAFRRFYLAYPEIRQTLSAEFKILKNQIDSLSPIRQTVSAESKACLNNGQNDEVPRVPISRLIKNIPFSAFMELMAIEEPLKRSFYEIEALRGQWSTRELKRQIITLYYERSAYSTDKQKLSALVNEKAETLPASNFIQDSYVFDFLGIKPRDALRENDLKTALLDKLQDFLLEMGKGFCFEARNKRILIGEKYRFVDIVLYHKILKRNVLIELKINEATHENVGQLNMYLGYYKRHEMSEGDKPPIGILLCTKKDETLVQYAQEDVNNDLFISNYNFALPEVKVLENFITQNLLELKEEFDEEK